MELFKETIEIPGEVLEEREIPSDIALVTPLVVRLVNRLKEESFIDPSQAMKIKLCFDEAITNAVVHGNRSQFDKVVRVWMFRESELWGVVIRDQGDGFDLATIASATESEEDLIWRENGRGLPLMEMFMDVADYYDDGRTLLLKKKISS